MAEIDYYFTTISPFTYLAGQKLEAIAARRGATINYKPFNLMELGQKTGFVPPKDRHPNRQKYRLQELKRIAAHEGLPITLKPAFWPANPVPSSAAIISAAKAGGGDIGALTHGLMRACWAEEKNIADDDIVSECLIAAGFDADLGTKGMLSAVETFERNTNEALDAGVFGSPFYVVGEECFWGQDRLDYLDRHLGE
ncbi:2-hydroxychromene-2-carboxylate isomerase [Algicella marina]|uniref:2-hydroxychromene-2-carboxylate isomerase n=1 Tax=Algicella marina TaxID=2683284 RepID=A0A6P1T4L5_9RHOB|nr:2-hydroxychromene-2-carboxylate isomerase [Algicella marina]QHQ36209.1 2-hydroxychromene-2-carboxylate isomerase [Algicella marina]